MSHIKMARAAKFSKLSRCPKTWEAVIAAIPEQVKAQCSGKQIAALADAMRAQYDMGHTAGYQDAQK